MPMHMHQCGFGRQQACPDIGSLTWFNPVLNFMKKNEKKLGSGDWERGLTHYTLQKIRY